jgi:hypothetical protein
MTAAKVPASQAGPARSAAATSMHAEARAVRAGCRGGYRSSRLPSHHTAGAQATEAASATLVAGRHVIPSASSNRIDAKLAFAAATC